MGRWRTVPLVAGLLVLAAVLAGCTAPAPDAEERADARLLVLTSLDAAWSGSTRYSRPATVTPRFFLPDGWGFKIQECMRDSGFEDFRFDPVGPLGAPEPRGTEALARYECIERNPTYDTRYSALTGSQLDTLWEYYTDFLRPCLALRGVEVGEVPARGDFAGAGEGMAGGWNPWLTARLPASVADTRAVLAACPPYPRGWVAPRPA